MVIHSVQKAPEADGKRLLEILDMHTTEEKILLEAVDIIRSTDSVNYAKQVSKEILEKAWKDCNEVLVDGPSKDHLHELAFFLIDRDM